jgi:hypothetical protein
MPQPSSTLKERLKLTDSQICKPYVYPSGSHTDSSFFSTSSLLSPIDCKELITSSYELGQSLSYQTHRQHTTQLVCVSVARTRNCSHSELVGIESPLFTKVPTRTGHRFSEKQFAKILNPGSNLGHFWRLVQSHGGRHEKKKKDFYLGAVGPPPLLGCAELLGRRQSGGPGLTKSILV